MTDSLEISFLQAYFTRKKPRGAEVHTEQLVKGLEDRGHHVTIHTDARSKRRSSLEDLRIEEYETLTDMNPITEFTLAKRAQEHVKETDLVVLNDLSGAFLSEVDVPTVVLPHLVWRGRTLNEGLLACALHHPHWLLYQKIERRLYNKANVTVAISDSIRDDIMTHKIQEDELFHIRNGVDVNRFSPTREEYDRFTVYFQGHLVDMKNPALLVEAVTESVKDWHLVIGGDGPQREQLEELVEDHGVGSRVEFLGYVPDEELPSRDARSDVYTLPSVYEGMPLTVLEAAASGTPAVVSPRAASDFADDDVGRVVEPTPGEFAATLDSLSNSPDLVANLGDNARERALEFSWDQTIDEYEQLFENVVGQIERKPA